MPFRARLFYIKNTYRVPLRPRSGSFSPHQGFDDMERRIPAAIFRGHPALFYFAEFTPCLNLTSERRAPNYDTFVGFIEFFHCSADFLLGLKENVYENDTYKPVQPFHERLRIILRKTETSQYLFVKRTKISWGVFYHWLTGKSNPSLDNLIKVANYFDCSVDFLLGRI